MRRLNPASVLFLHLLSPGLTNGADEKDAAAQANLAQQLFTASVRGDLMEVQSLHAKGVDVDVTNGCGLTAYQGAKVRGQEAVAQWLAEHGARQLSVSRWDCPTLLCIVVLNDRQLADIAPIAGIDPVL
ncbi:MAG: ankyrin repeat domain-containing protein, partial [Planctomycetia bacterium]|nr:ankyrin repeat domain-containing protein [Planctomycetia bacterium]